MIRFLILSWMIIQPLIGMQEDTPPFKRAKRHTRNRKFEQVKPFSAREITIIEHYRQLQKTQLLIKEAKGLINEYPTEEQFITRLEKEAQELESYINSL